jgi:hypothetical protein
MSPNESSYYDHISEQSRSFGQSGSSSHQQQANRGVVHAFKRKGLDDFLIYLAQDLKASAIYIIDHHQADSEAVKCIEQIEE